MAEKSVVHGPKEGDAFWMLGGLYEVRLSSGETNGAVTVMELTIPEGAGPPPHIHRDVDETVYILEGNATYRIGDETVQVSPGSVLHLPAGTRETFEPQGKLRILLSYRPGGIDKFFAEAGEPAKSRQIPPPPTSPPDLERLAEIASRYRLELQPPPTRRS